MRTLALASAEWVFRLPWMRRPKWLAAATDCRPSGDALRPDLVILEIRNGYRKWAHFRCPRCGDHIELPMAGREKWTINVDWLQRPTIFPSVWERATCGAHFFIRGGEPRWSRE
jgi:hypothetical protein